MGRRLAIAIAFSNLHLTKKRFPPDPLKSKPRITPANLLQGRGKRNRRNNALKQTRASSAGSTMRG